MSKFPTTKTLQKYNTIVCRGCSFLSYTAESAPSHGRTLLSFMCGSVGAPWGETTPRINDMRDMHCVTPVGCGGDVGLGYLNSPTHPIAFSKASQPAGKIQECASECVGMYVCDWCWSLRYTAVQ